MKRVHVKRIVRVDGENGILLSNGDLLEGVVSVDFICHMGEINELSIQLLLDENSVEIGDSIINPEIIDL